MSNRRSGIMYLKVNGEAFDAKGNFTYNSGKPKREAIVGNASVHGYKETPQTPYIEGEITDRGNLDVDNLKMIDDATVTLELANGKTFLLRNAWYAGDGDVGTEEANIGIRFEGLSGEEIRP